METVNVTFKIIGEETKRVIQLALPKGMNREEAYNDMKMTISSILGKEVNIMHWMYIKDAPLEFNKKQVAYPATLLCDFYKISHREQYPKNTEKIYATWTARTSRMKNVDQVVFFGLQAFIKEYLIDYFNANFFARPVEDIVEEYKRVLKYTLGKEEVDASHLIELHKLGYLPIKIKAVEEGTLVPIKVPMFTIENTNDKFFWLTNYLETLMSCMLWQPMTSATISLEYRKLLEKYAIETNGDTSGVQFQGHDFSMRGMSSLESAKSSGAGHLLSFTGTDTIPAILHMENFYNANVETELVGTSIPATEHSVQCCYGQEDEIGTFKRLISEIYPTGIMSIVSDTWDLWKVLTEYLPQIKDDVMARDGKVVIRPDSGDPVDIVCGTARIIDMNCEESLEVINIVLEDMAWDDLSSSIEDNGYQDYIDYLFTFKGKTYIAKCNGDITTERGGYSSKKYYTLMGVDVSVEEYELTPKDKGVIQLLWETFGGEITEKGYKQLDSHIGCIYGDAITIDRCKEICDRLRAKGFASTNMVYGIGSFTYQYNTRDTFGFALKTTYAVVDGEERQLFKDPITDNGVKRSQRGKVAVFEKDGRLTLIDGLNDLQHKNVRNDVLKDVFVNGRLTRETSLREIRDKVSQHIGE